MLQEDLRIPTHWELTAAVQQETLSSARKDTRPTVGIILVACTFIWAAKIHLVLHKVTCKCSNDRHGARPLLGG